MRIDKHMSEVERTAFSRGKPRQHSLGAGTLILCSCFGVDPDLLLLGYFNSMRKFATTNSFRECKYFYATPGFLQCDHYHLAYVYGTLFERMIETEIKKFFAIFSMEKQKNQGLSQGYPWFD